MGTENDSIGVVILLDEAPIVEPQTMSLGAGGTAGIVIAVFIILVVIIILLIIVVRAKKNSQQTEEKLDEEKGIAEEEEADKTSQTESAHGDTEEGEEGAQKNLKERVTDFVVGKLKKNTEKKEDGKEKEVKEAVTDTETTEEKM